MKDSRGFHGTYGIWWILLQQPTAGLSGRKQWWLWFFTIAGEASRGLQSETLRKNGRGLGQLVMVGSSGWGVTQTCFFKKYFYYFSFFPQILREMIQLWRSHIFQLGWWEKPATSSISILVRFFSNKNARWFKLSDQTSPLIWWGGHQQALIERVRFWSFHHPTKGPFLPIPHVSASKHFVLKE